VTTKIRVLLAEDHAIVRHGLKLLIDSEPDMEVVGEASDGRAALERVAALTPSVAVLDVSMPEMNGLEATRAIRDQMPRTAVVALTRHGDGAYVRELVGAGALGYVLKQSASHELVRAIRAAAQGRKYLDPNLPISPLRSTPRTHRVPTATDREVEVLKLMAFGHSNKEIASTLDISVKTVEVHKANGMRKLDLQGRGDLVKYAMLQGWLRDLV
jgi:DNA-binding NarL/FixJ family response regulator